MIDTLLAQIAAQPPLEWLAVICSLVYVHFAAKQHLACWPFALLSTGLYTWLFWETSLFFQSVLNAWYLIMAVYGWYNWKNMDAQQERGIRTWNAKYHLKVVLALLLVSALCFELFSRLVEVKIIFLDLGIAVFSGFVTWMLTQKVLENWLYWIVINTLTAWLCFEQALYPSVLLFVLYVLFAIKGFLNWRNSQQLSVEQ